MDSPTTSIEPPIPEPTIVEQPVPKLALWEANDRLEELFNVKKLTRVYVSPDLTDCTEGQVRKRINVGVEFESPENEICQDREAYPSYEVLEPEDETDFQVRMFSKYPDAREQAEARKKLRQRMNDPFNQ